MSQTQAAIERAAALSGDGRHEEAVAALREALAANPEDLALTVELSRALTEAGQADEGFRTAMGALEHDLKSAVARIAAGHAALRRGDPELALTQFEHAVRLDPTDAEARQSRAQLLWYLGGQAGIGRAVSRRLGGDLRKIIPLAIGLLALYGLAFALISSNSVSVEDPAGTTTNPWIDFGVGGLILLTAVGLFWILRRIRRARRAVEQRMLPGPPG